MEDPSEEGMERLARSITRVGRGLEIDGMGKNGRRYAEHFCAWGSLAAAYERVLVSVAAKPRGDCQAESAGIPGVVASREGPAEE